MFLDLENRLFQSEIGIKNMFRPIESLDEFKDSLVAQFIIAPIIVIQSFFEGIILTAKIIGLLLSLIATPIIPWLTIPIAIGLSIDILSICGDLVRNLFDVVCITAFFATKSMVTLGYALICGATDLIDSLSTEAEPGILGI